MKYLLPWLPRWLSGKKNLPANAGDGGSIPGLEISPGEENGNPFQYSCLGNAMNREPGRVQSLQLKRIGQD